MGFKLHVVLYDTLEKDFFSFKHLSFKNQPTPRQQQPTNLLEPLAFLRESKFQPRAFSTMHKISNA